MKRLVLLLALLAIPAGAHAYLLSAGAVLHKIAAHRRTLQLSTMVVKGELTLHGAEAAVAARALGLPEGSPLSVPATAFYKLPGRCRVELQAAPGGEAIAVSNVNGKLSASGPALASLRAFAAYVCPLLDGREGISELARGAGIDTSVVALGRTNGVVAYVVGARPRETGVPSLWVEKDRFEPLRLVAKEGGGLREIQLIDYSSALAGEWHPRVVEIRQGAELTARFSLEKIEANGKLSDVVF